MSKIKVCHIITKLELGGAQGNTLYTVSHLNKERFEVILIAGPGGILDRETEKLENVRTYFLPSLIRTANPFNDVLSLFKLWSILHCEKPQIVHTHSSKAGILGRWAAHFANVPLIIHTFHGFGFHDFQLWPVRTLFSLIERVTAKISDKLIVVSSDNIEKGLKFSVGRREQYLIIRSGIDVKKYARCNCDKAKIREALGLKPGQQVVTTIGPFKPQKNLKDFVTASAEVLKTCPDTVFLIIGDGAQRETLEKQINKLNISNNVKLLGWRRDIAELLSITDVFVLTSLWEGLPRSILEAMCSGIPVVANAVDGVNEIVKEAQTGYLTAPKNPQATAENIIKLLKDRDLSTKMGKSAKALITEEYDIDLMVTQQEELYTNLIK